jgi:putative membrane protein
MSQPPTGDTHDPQSPSAGAGHSGRALAPPVPGAPAVKQTERPHPLTPFIRGWLILVAATVAFGRELVPDGRTEGRPSVSEVLWAAPLLLLVALAAGVAGFMSWYFTRFVIDEEELRIETGAVFRNSRRVAFERLQSIDVIQPLAARMFGLAELRLEVGGTDATVKLRYLSRANATLLRDYLLARAHGEKTSRAAVGQGPGASALTDLGTTDTPLVTVPPHRLVGGLLLSTDWLLTAVATVVGLVVAASYGALGYALPALAPLLIGSVTLVSRRVIGMFHFTLAQSPRGLRVTRGLTSLTSQSVPVDRIQGVRVSQSILWRPAGWFRVDVDIFGYGTSSDENNENGATSVLLPVATLEEVRLALREVLPGVDLDAVTLHPSPRRARWLHWFTAQTLRYGWSPTVLVTEGGLLTWARDIVPHAKTQSVRIVQGPLQRRLHLADVHVDTPRGPVNAVAHELDEAVARKLALSQLDRAREARGFDRARTSRRATSPAMPPAVPPPSSQPHTPDEAVLAAFGLDEAAFLGEGSESRVFALDDTRVLRLYRSSHENPVQVSSQLKALSDLWRTTDIGFETPLVREVGQVASRTYTVDRRLSGRPFVAWLATATTEERRTALRSYLNLACSLSRLPPPVPGFARLVGEGAPERFDTLADVLVAQLRRVIGASRERLAADLPDVARVWSGWHVDISQRVVQPAVVHGDLCPANAFCSRGPDGSVVVTGVVDFSPHTLTADPLMDVTGAICFLELEPYAEAGEDAAWLTDVAVEQLGEQIRPWLETYRVFYGFYFSSAHTFDEHLYGWCLRQLQRGADRSRPS